MEPSYQVNTKTKYMILHYHIFKFMCPRIDFIFESFLKSILEVEIETFQRFIKGVEYFPLFDLWKGQHLPVAINRLLCLFGILSVHALGNF